MGEPPNRELEIRIARLERLVGELLRDNDRPAFGLPGFGRPDVQGLRAQLRANRANAE